MDKFNCYGFKSEREMFDYLWETCAHTCFVSGEGLGKYYGSNFWFNCFAHILPKGSYPEFRLYINNIALVSPTIHTLFDNTEIKRILSYESDTGNSFYPLFELEHVLLEEYKSETGKKRKMRNVVNEYFEIKNL